MREEFLFTLSFLEFYNDVMDHELEDLYYCNDKIIIKTIHTKTLNINFYYYDGEMYRRTLTLPEDSVLVTRDRKTQIEIFFI